MALVLTVIVILSIIVSFLIVNLARLSGHIKITQGTRDYKPSLDTTISNELNTIVESAHNKKELVKLMRETIDREVKKSVDIAAKNVSTKYEKVLQDKNATEEIITRKYKKVISEKKQTEMIVRSIAEGLVVVDRDGKVLLMNPAAEKILNVKREDKINKSILSDLEEGQLVSMMKEGKESQERIIELLSSKEDVKKVIRSSSAVIEDENGRTVGMVSVLTDMTKQRELDRMKANFINTITHEFRTPLVAIEKSISVVLEGATGSVTKQQENFLNIANRNIERLSHLIDDMLELSRLESRSARPKLESCSIGSIIDDVCETLKTWADSKSIIITKNVQVDLPNLLIDSFRINQVFTNIIGNAIKFVPKGGNIKVEALYMRDGNSIVASVKDNGPGIPKEEQSKIFDKFYQIGDRVSTDVSGSGLGLSIAKEIVEMHDGKIWVESEKGIGAKFNFVLPIKHEEAKNGIENTNTVD